MKIRQNDFQEILKIGISLTTEKDRNKLLNDILEESMKITSADAGTLYIFEKGLLYFKIMKTISLGINKKFDSKSVEIPPVPMEEENVCAYAAIHRESVNISDVRHDQRFCFLGPEKYDGLTGYHTESMLVIPLVNNEDEVIGVLQLINALDEEGKITKFHEDYVFYITSLASQAAITLTNMNYVEELKEQIWSFTEALSTAIDARTPYNATHTRKVADYAGQVADYFQEAYEKGEFSEGFDKHRKEQLVMGALLHDIGKLIVPLEIMNKPTRLDSKLGKIQDRFLLFKSYASIHELQGDYDEATRRSVWEQLDSVLQQVQELNTKKYLTEDDLQRVGEFEEMEFPSPTGEKIPYFQADELECLRIRKGTLTAAERAIMEKHVAMTGKILEKVHFNRYFKDCVRWAVSHHETLDGRGYPNHLPAEQLPLESRILAVTDIYDALTSKDRPYKEPMSSEQAFSVLENMVREGKLDGTVVLALKECII